jgi:hypothetical protein
MRGGGDSKIALFNVGILRKTVAVRSLDFQKMKTKEFASKLVNELKSTPSLSSRLMLRLILQSCMQDSKG